MYVGQLKNCVVRNSKPCHARICSRLYRRDKAFSGSSFLQITHAPVLWAQATLRAARKQGLLTSDYLYQEIHK